MWSTDFELQGEDILKNSTIRFCEVLGIDQKYVDIVKKLLNSALPGLGNSFFGNGQDQNKK
jgi:hypothetical protein